MRAPLLGTGGGVLLGLGVAVGRPDSVEPVYKVSSEVVLSVEVLETDPEVIPTASERKQLTYLSNKIKGKESGKKPHNNCKRRVH